jgi:hypothetical protein
MSRTLNITFTSAEAEAGLLTSRVRNFAEDLQRELDREHVGKVENMDTAVSAVMVHVESTRKLGVALTLARAMLRRHNFIDNVSIEH